VGFFESLTFSWELLLYLHFIDGFPGSVDCNGIRIFFGAGIPLAQDMDPFKKM
jgi:hypothetical protein